MAVEVGTPMNRRGIAGFSEPISLQDGSKQNKVKNLAQVGNWQRALREFMQNEARLSDLVSLYGQKFVQLGENKNFTLSTLTDMVWTVLVLTWEAILENKLPLVGEADAGYQKKYMDLQDRFNQMRAEWLKEVSNLRDQQRQKKWNDEMQEALDLSMEQDCFTFVPENALDAQTREYFKMSMQENMKMALIKGAAAASGQTQWIVEKLKQAEEELETAKAKIEQLDTENLKLASELAEAQEELKAAGEGKPKEKVVKVDRTDNAKSEKEIAQLKQDKEALEMKLDRLLKKLRALGFDGDIDDDFDPEALKKRWVLEAERAKEMSKASAKRGGEEAEAEKIKQVAVEAEERARKVENERLATMC